MADRYPRLDFTPVAASGGHVPARHPSSLLEWFEFWPKVGRDEGVVERVPEFVPFDHEVGSWLG